MLKQSKNQEKKSTVIAKKPKASLMERVDQYYSEKNEWKKMNGACPISEDIDPTLQLLQDNVTPMTVNLPEMIRVSVAKYTAEGRTFEQIWSYKIQEGANSVAVVDGVFGFYRGAEKLPTKNIPLQIPAMPIVLELREKERLLIMFGENLAKQAMLVNFREVKTVVTKFESIDQNYQVTQTGTALEISELGVTGGQL